MKVRIAIIGSGRMGQRHAEAYKKIKHVQLIGFADEIKDSARSLAKKFNSKALTIDQIILDKNIDAVSVCTPNAFHAEICIRMLRSKKHVLVEKPIAIKLNDCDKMIRAAKQNGVKFMVGQTYRFYPSSIAAKKIIDSGKIGSIKIIQIHGVDPGFIPGKGKMPEWFGKKESGGGLLFDLIHAVDLMRYWLDTEISEVSVPITDKIHRNVNVEELALVVLKFKNGSAASIMALAPSWGIRDTGIKIIGEKGILDVTYGKEVKVGSKKWQDVNFPYKSKNPTYEHNLMGFVNEISEFINCIIKNKDPEISGEEGKKNLSVILAMYKAAKTKKIIKLKL